MEESTHSDVLIREAVQELAAALAKLEDAVYRLEQRREVTP